MSLLSRLFTRQPDPREELRPLWHRAVALARDPAWYREGGIADSVDGRFDAITLVLALVLLRLEREEGGERRAALLTELFVEDMDGQLRQAGVGDVVMGKRMGKLMGALGGRLAALREALAGDGDEALVSVVARNATFGEAGNSTAVAAGLRALATTLEHCSLEALLAGDFGA